MNSDNYTVIEKQNLTTEDSAKSIDDTQKALQTEEVSQIEVLTSNEEQQPIDHIQVTKEEVNGEDNQKISDQLNKMNILYFIGVNSLTLNFLNSILKFNLINLSLGMLIANLITYIILYKYEQVQQLSSKSTEKSQEIYQMIKQETNKERILIGFGVIIVSSLLILSISNTIQIYQFEHYQSKQINLTQQQQSHYLAQLRQLSLQQEHNNLINKQLDHQLNIQAIQQKQQQNYLNQRVNQLTQAIQNQSSYLNQLKKDSSKEINRSNTQYNPQNQSQVRQPQQHQQYNNSNNNKLQQRKFQSINNIFKNIFSFPKKVQYRFRI